jgi:dihydrofolate reductase
MRKLVVLSFISLDGVMQAPGGPEEDTSDGFKLGGWTVGYFDEAGDKIMSEQLGHRFDLLLGRRTYDIFAAYWPHQDHEIARALNSATKYVVSQSPVSIDWKTMVAINGDVVDRIRQLKAEDGPELQVHGSGNLIQTLLKHELVDELWLKTFPVLLGTGKRLFAEGTIPGGWRLLESQVTPSGVIVANYRRAGEVKVGSFDQSESNQGA